MEVVTATSAGHPGRENEDVVAVGASSVMLVDGAGIPGGELTCRHGVAWYARELASVLSAGVEGPARLTDALADAITHVTRLHRATCDVRDPRSPSAAVAVVRLRGDRLEHLVLGDATVVVGRRSPSGPLVVADRREVVIASAAKAALATASTPLERQALLDGLRARRNALGGFWVAKDDPAAAAEALTGSTALDEVSEVAVLSNGASRLVDTLGRTDWPGLLGLLRREGPDALIGLVRTAEEEDALATDDATATLLTP